MMSHHEATETLVSFALANPPDSTAERLVLADAIGALRTSRSDEAKKVAAAIRAAEAAQLDFFRQPGVQFSNLR